jgi:hypothetical protein
MRQLINVGIYQLIWFLCVLLGDRGGLIALPCLFLHLYLSPSRLADLQMMGLLLLAGTFIDGSLLIGGFFSFLAPAHPIPFWLAVVWLALGTLPHHSLAWMQKRPIFAAVFGAFGGPLAYWAGVRLGAASFNLSLLSSLLILALIWGFLWPIVMAVSSLQWQNRRFKDLL